MCHIDIDRTCNHRAKPRVNSPVWETKEPFCNSRPDGSVQCLVVSLLLPLFRIGYKGSRRTMKSTDGPQFCGFCILHNGFPEPKITFVLPQRQNYKFANTDFKKIATVAQSSEFLATDPEVPGSISGAT
jgi:hypothetical protein